MNNIICSINNFNQLRHNIYYNFNIFYEFSVELIERTKFSSTCTTFVATVEDWIIGFIQKFKVILSKPSVILKSEALNFFILGTFFVFSSKTMFLEASPKTITVSGREYKTGKIFSIEIISYLKEIAKGKKKETFWISK